MVRDDQLVIRGKRERTKNRVHAGGCVGNERQVVWWRADEGAEGAANVVEERFELPNQKSHRLLLHAPAELVLLREHDLRRRSERAVIQIRD